MGEDTKTKLICLVLSAVGIYWLCGLSVHAASAEPKPGLWWKSKTEGLAQVQKLEDSSNGVVCYVAIGDSSPAGPSISCVKP